MVPFHVNPCGLQNAVNGLRYIQNFRGGIITMPHKKQTLSLLDSASDAARATGGCNVIRRDTNGMLHGDMLDGEEFALSLLTRDINVEGKKVYLAGTGGAGCAIAYAMAARQVKELIIYNRTMDKSTELIKSCHPGIQTLIFMRVATFLNRLILLLMLHLWGWGETKVFHSL